MKYISIKYQIFQFHAFNTEKGRNTIEGQRSAEYYYYKCLPSILRRVKIIKWLLRKCLLLLSS